ncbi:hypothetical protein HOY80DRAFT_1027842 [Tuber brumale]|nr:hypothetical protein HOY80DRAFT_1027842 [Tuber brumale]
MEDPEQEYDDDLDNAGDADEDTECDSDEWWRIGNAQASDESCGGHAPPTCDREPVLSGHQTSPCPNLRLTCHDGITPSTGTIKQRFMRNKPRMKIEMVKVTVKAMRPDSQPHPRSRSTGQPAARPRSTLKLEAKDAITYEITPYVVAPQSTSINNFCATPCMRWVFTGGSGSYIRRFD